MKSANTSSTCRRRHVPRSLLTNQAVHLDILITKITEDHWNGRPGDEPCGACRKLNLQCVSFVYETHVLVRYAHAFLEEELEGREVEKELLEKKET